jgi:hypothetical protein
MLFEHPNPQFRQKAETIARLTEVLKPFPDDFNLSSLLITRGESAITVQEQWPPHRTVALSLDEWPSFRAFLVDHKSYTSGPIPE